MSNNSTMQIFEATANEWNQRQRDMNEELGCMDPDDDTLKRPFMLGEYRAILTGQMETSNGVAWTAEIITPRHRGATIYIEQRGNGGQAFVQCKDQQLLADFTKSAFAAFGLDPGERHLDDVAELATLFLLDFNDAIDASIHASRKTG